LRRGWRGVRGRACVRLGRVTSRGLSAGSRRLTLCGCAPAELCRAHLTRNKQVSKNGTYLLARMRLRGYRSPDTPVTKKRMLDRRQRVTSCVCLSDPSFATGVSSDRRAGHCAASCSACVAWLARFQGGGRLILPHPRPLPKGRSGSRPIFCTWGRRPPTLRGQIWAGWHICGTLRGLQIGYRGLMIRWISLTSAWLGAAKAPLGRRSSRFPFRVEPRCG